MLTASEVLGDAGEAGGSFRSQSRSGAGSVLAAHPQEGCSGWEGPPHLLSDSRERIADVRRFAMRRAQWSCWIHIAGCVGSEPESGRSTRLAR
jgi:hypothetical protein